MAFHTKLTSAALITLSSCLMNKLNLKPQSGTIFTLSSPLTFLKSVMPIFQVNYRFQRLQLTNSYLDYSSETTYT